MNEAFRAALWEFGERGRMQLRARRSVRQVCANPFAMDMLRAQLEAEMPSEALGEFGDGAILDKFAQWVKWIIEHQDQILAFIEKIIKIIVDAFLG